MKGLSRTVQGIERAPIRFILDRAAHYPDAIHLEIGQPDFPTPAHVIEAAVDAARNKYTGYTANAGIDELRDAACVKLERENNLHVTRDQIMITIGAMEAVFASMAVLLDPGDEILLPDPGYCNFVMASQLVHSQFVPYPAPAENGFEPDLDAMEELVTDRTKAMLVNSPSNPTGTVYSRETLRACLDFCRRHDLYLISDETYDRLIYEGEHVSPAIWDDEGRVISIYTVSKTYSMTGWRVGYVAAAPEIVNAMVKIQEPVVSCVNTVAQHASVAALLGPQDCVQEMLAQYKKRRELAVKLTRELGLSGSNPQGAFYMLVDISDQPRCSMDFACDLLEQEEVAVAPGCAFGDRCERYVRISLCASEEDLAEGLTRLARYLDANSVSQGRRINVGEAAQ